MRDEEKALYEKYFGCPFDEISAEDRAAFEKTLIYKLDVTRKVLQPVIENFNRAIQNAGALLRKIFKTVNDQAEAGEPAARYQRGLWYVKYYENKLAEVEKLLAVTKKTTARKPLLERRKHYMERIERYRRQIEEAMDALNDDGRKESS